MQVGGRHRRNQGPCRWLLHVRVLFIIAPLSVFALYIATIHPDLASVKRSVDQLHLFLSAFDNTPTRISK